MAWSTSQLAQLAGTTIKAVRRYHEMGILDQPLRKVNGSELYEVAHLLRLLQISRLFELGLQPSQAVATNSERQVLEPDYRALDTTLASIASRLNRVRRDLAFLLTTHSPVEPPAAFVADVEELFTEDRLLLLFYSRDSIGWPLATGSEVAEQLLELEVALDALAICAEPSHSQTASS